MQKHLIVQWPEAPAHWPAELQQEYAANLGRGRVGSRLVSTDERVLVWHLSLKPAERIGFHTHVLDYFWTVLTAGRARSHYSSGETREVAYAPGDTTHHKFAAGEFMIHDLENIGDTELVFTTVEFVDSPNARLPI